MLHQRHVASNHPPALVAATGRSNTPQRDLYLGWPAASGVAMPHGLLRFGCLSARPSGAGRCNGTLVLSLVVPPVIELTERALQGRTPPRIVYVIHGVLHAFGAGR